MGDVGEGAAVDQGGVAFEGLDEVGRECVLEDRRHCADGAEVRRGDGIAGRGPADDDAAEPFTQVVEGVGHAEGRHDLAGRGDVEARLARDPAEPPAEADDDVAQGAIVHVDRAADGDGARVDVVSAEMQCVVRHRGEQIVGLGDGREIAGEVEVDLVAGRDLGLPPADGAALDAENRPHRGLAKGEHRALA